MLSALIKPVSSMYFVANKSQREVFKAKLLFLFHCRFCFAVRLKFLLRQILRMFSHLTFFNSEWHAGSITLPRFVDVGENIDNETLLCLLYCLFFKIVVKLFAMKEKWPLDPVGVCGASLNRSGCEGFSDIVFSILFCF